MTDLISRAEAINAICEDGTKLERQGQYSMTMVERKQRDADILEALPSEQPEPIRLRLDHELSKEEYERLKKDCAEQPIILLPKESAQPGEDIRAMCGECDAWNQYKNHPQPGWIPCSETEEAPEYEVIACNADGEEMLGYLSTDGVDWECDSAYELMTDVVAWMKKPIPWEGEPNE